MKYLLWIVGLFTAAAALTVALRSPGYVMLVYPPYRIELSLSFFIVLLLLAFVASYGLIRLTYTVLRLPDYARRFRQGRAHKESRELQDKVLSAFFEGRYAEAEKAAARAMEKGEASALYPIIAARSAHELREYKKRDAYLSAAGGKKIGDSTMRLMATTKFMLDQHDPKAALNALQELRESGIKGHLGAMTLELKARQQAGDWDEVLSLLVQLEKRDSIDALAAANLRQQAWMGKVRQQKDLVSATACVKSAPTDIRKSGKFAVAASSALTRHGGCSLAQQLLTDSLNTKWDSDLVAVYGDCQSDNVVKQIEQAEKWLADHKQDAGLLLALGKLCLQQKLWGKAQNYLEASISLAPSHAAYDALGNLAGPLGKPEDASMYYQRAMKLK